MTRGVLLRGQYWPLTAVSAVLGIGVIAGLFAFASMADQAAHYRERELVQRGIAGRLGEIAQRPTGQALWDDAVTNLDVSFDKSWAQDNVGTFLSGTQGFELAAVLDRSDTPVYAMRDGSDIELRRDDPIYRSAAPLIDKVRAGEVLRGPIAPLIEKLDGDAPDTIYASDLYEVNGQLISLTATLVQPDFGTALPATERSAIILTGDVIDQSFVSLLAERYLLSNARFVPPGSDTTPRRAIRNSRAGAPPKFSFIAWTPQRPGRDMLILCLPMTLMALSSLAMLAWHFRRKGRQATESLIASEARASHLAYYDPLTGLPNRLLLSDRLERALDHLRRDNRPFAVYCMDLDRFREISDRFGQQAGDDLIRHVAQTLAVQIGPEDTLARLGTDEFAIIQYDATPERVTALATRFNELLSAPVEIAAGFVFTGCSVGVALIAGDVLDAQDCYRQADLALNRVRASGGGAFAVFEPGMDAALRLRLEIRDELRKALANGDLSVHYQPQVRHGGKMYGVEALIRWTHPVRGRLAPSVFVPIAEESGLIEALGMFVLRRAFEDTKRLGNLRVAINLSAVQFRLKNFISDLTELVKETGVDVGQVELEITESLLLGDDPSVLQTLEQLRTLGFRIALDDFGTGYSSLSYLQRFPIDKIKIDRSFVANLGTESQADAVVTAIVRLGRALGLDVIAEGVETELQRIRLAAAGCDDIQGYLYGKPMPLADIESRMLAEPVQPAPSHAATYRISG